MYMWVRPTTSYSVHAMRMKCLIINYCYAFLKRAPENTFVLSQSRIIQHIFMISLHEFI